MYFTRIISFLLLTGACTVTTAQIPQLVLQKGHFKKINSIRFSNNGRQIVTSSDDGILKTWDAFSQKLVSETGGNGLTYIDAGFSASGKYMLTNAIPPGETGFGSNAYNNPQYFMLYNNTPLYIWNTENNTLRYSFTSRRDAYSVSPDCSFIAVHPAKTTKKDPVGVKPSLTNEVLTATYGSPILIYQTATGKLYSTIDAFEDTTKNYDPFLAFVSDSTLLIGVQTKLSNPQKFLTTYHLYNFISKHEIKSFADSSNSSKSGWMTLSPGRKYFLRYEEELKLYPGYAGNHEAFTELWDIKQGKKIWQMPMRLRNVFFSDHDSTVMLIHEKRTVEQVTGDPPMRRITRFSVKDTSRIYQLTGTYLDDVLACSSPSGNDFAVVSLEEHEYKLPAPHMDTSYRINTWNGAMQLKSTCSSKSPVTAMTFSPDGKYLVTGYKNGDFSVWDTGDSLSAEIANSGNNIDPVLNIHSSSYTDKIFYATKGMYAFQADKAINKLSYITNGNLPLKDMQYLLRDKFSILNFSEEFSPVGQFQIVDNSIPAVVKSVQYSATGSLTFQWDKETTDMFNRYKWSAKLHYPGLDEFLIYDTLVSFINSRRHTMPPDLGLIYGVLKSGQTADSTLILPGYQSIKYNAAMKGYVFVYDNPYFIRKSKLNSIVPIYPKKGAQFLPEPVLSDDGIHLLGQFQSVDTIIISDHYDCQDLNGNIVFKTPLSFQKDNIGVASRFTFSADKKTACILSDPSSSPGANFVRVIDAKNGNPLYNLKANSSGSITSLEYTKDSKHLYTRAEGGTCTKWNLATGKEEFTIVFFKDHDYAILLPSGYYFISSRTDTRYMNFKLNNRLYNFNQFDLQFNRPDTVLKAIGSTDIRLMQEYRSAWLSRIKKAGYTEATLRNSQLQVPELFVNNSSIPPVTQQRELSVSFAVADSLFAIRNYNIFVNDVPLYGINGKALAQPAQHAAITSTLLLNEGLNKIEINCTNENAAASRKEVLYITYTPEKMTAHKTWFIGIGINQYSRGSSFVDLSYCVKDIRDLATAFKNKYGDDIVIDTLMNDQASRENILALKEKLLQTAVDDKVVISFSGHGMVDPLHPDDFYFVTSNTRIGNPAENGVSYAELEELLDSIPARKKLLLLDACHSGESDETANAGNAIPGTKKGSDENDKSQAGSIEILDIVKDNAPASASTTDIFKLMKEAFADIRRNNGAYVLSAAQSNESAGEGGGTSNGWFSSCLLEQLKQTSHISVNELSQKVNQCVNARSGGNQHTDNRQELAESNWQLW